MDKALISVIVPIYKVEQYLDECVQSIINQTYKNLEIILVDDGSPDNCGKMCDEYAERDSRIKVIHKPNGGLSDARNVGIDIAKGEYISFVDSDDCIELNMLEALFDALKNNNTKMSCCGRYDVYEGEKLKGLCPLQNEVVTAEKMLLKIFSRKECDFVAWDKLYHRSLFEGVRYPVGEIYEDAATTYKLITLASDVSLISIPLYNYRHREQSIMTEAFSKKNLIILKHTDEMIYFIKEHHPKILREAELYYNQCILGLLTVINTSSKDMREKYSHVYKELLIKLYQRKSYWNGKDRLKYYMFKTGTYVYFKKIVDCIRRER